jgi:aminoglycoside phosphotransferase (APT) family kinase protein
VTPPDLHDLPEDASSSAGTPAAEFAIDDACVARLLAHQHPDLAHLPLREVGEGWDNALFRLGDDLAVRLPRRSAAAPLILHEQAWLPRLASRLSLPVPTPYRDGTPALGYPWHWSVVPWLPGMPADQHAIHSSETARFAAFLRSLHVAAPVGAPVNPFRGVPLGDRAVAIEERIHRVAARTSLITPQVRDIWQQALQSPIDVTPTWLHGDLHPRNVLVEDGVITGIIDWGDMTSGDCATDLASVWMLFDTSDARQQALTAYASCSRATLQRAMGWAVLFGVTFLDTGLIDNRRNAAIGEEILRRVTAPA